MDNGQLSKKTNLVSGANAESLEVQNVFQEDLSSGPRETIEQIDAIAETNLESGEKIQMEMPPGEDAKNLEIDSSNANLEIRGYGDNGKFGNGNFKDMKKAIIAASNDPHELNDAIQELSEEISGAKKAV